jgi:NADPH2:quinone reductase
MTVHHAIRVSEFGGPSVLVLDKSCDLPTMSEPTDVVIAVAHAGVNPVDTHIIAGKFGARPTPFTPGSDGAGVVTAVGTNVQRIKVGDRVFFTQAAGSYAQHTKVDEAHVYKLDNRLTTEQGASIGVPYFTAYRSLFQRCWAKEGETVLIHGASGAVGVACIQIARAYKLVVIGTAGTPEGVELITKLGCHHSFNHREDGYMNKVKAAAGSGGVHVVMEMVANKNLNHDLDILAPDGRVCVIGSHGNVEISPFSLMMKEAYVTGVILFKTTPAQWREMGIALSK